MVREYLPPIDARGLKVCIVASRYGRVVTERLVHGALECLAQHGCPEDGVDLYWVPGSFEIPPVARHRAATGNYDLLLALGCIVRGDTTHFDYIAKEVSRGVAQVGWETGVATIFGVVTAETMEQAIERSGIKGGGRGWDAAQAGIEMVHLLRTTKQSASSRKRGVKH
ncbi:MAG: 6,7-dimethyl-8-ribityllumazine synthase [Candidatus Eisenbacteria sp.]|nr:6,7-dimethyl-8-ribityllumazine synthase [Candidatus Eisenbacteria bacterium]